MISPEKVVDALLEEWRAASEALLPFNENELKEWMVAGIERYVTELKNSARDIPILSPEIPGFEGTGVALNSLGVRR